MPPEPVATQLFTLEELARNEAQKRAMMDLFVSEETVLVIGAGCSVRLQYPSWPALLAKLEALAVEIAADCGVAFNPNPIQAREDPLQYAGSIKTFIDTCDGGLDKYYGLLSGEFRKRNVDSFHLHWLRFQAVAFSQRTTIHLLM